MRAHHQHEHAAETIAQAEAAIARLTVLIARTKPLLAASRALTIRINDALSIGAVK